jgi:hypothetical protein
MQLTILAWLLIAAVFKIAYASNADSNSEASAFYVLCADFGYLQADSSGEINFVWDPELASQFVHDEGTLALSGSSKYSGSVLILQFGQRLTLGTKDSSSTRWAADGDNLLHNLSDKEAVQCDGQSSSSSVLGIQIGVETLVQAATSIFCKQNCLTRIAIE